MKAFVITLEGHDYSERKASACIESASSIGGIDVERFAAVAKDDAHQVMTELGLRWSWAKMNTAPDVCPMTGLKQHPYGHLAAKIGCSMSHFLLWKKCVELGEPILILEHDALFVRRFSFFAFDGICQINDPAGATPHGKWWSDSMRARGPGVFRKMKVFEDAKPDGLAGNSAYVIKPRAAQGLIDAFRQFGVWPNDATMCRQLFFLQELFPFVTRVDQQVSTTSQ